MNRRRSHSNNSFDLVIANVKDYIVPIIGIFLVLILIWTFFLRGSGEETVTNENTVGIPLMVSEGVEAEILNTKGKKNAYEAGDDLHQGETLIIKKGKAKVNTQDYVFNINERGELAYDGGEKFTIENGNIWLDTTESIDISMRYATVNVGKNSHVSFTQNEVGSTVYLISGTAEVKNNAGVSTALAGQEKIEISKKDTTDEEVDLALVKEPLGDFFTNSDWFIVNNGASYLIETQDDEEESEDEKEATAPAEVAPTVGNDFLTFGNLIDGSNVSAASVNVYGNYSQENISKIIVNNTKEATLNKEQKSFNIEGVITDSKTNDLVFKVYDTDNKEISRFVYTVFYPDAKTEAQKQAEHQKAQQKNKETTSQDGAQTTFDANPSDFIFTKPTTGATYTTNEDFVTIRGTVSDKRITKIIIRGHKLSSFNGSTWRYHAQESTKNLATGTNVYDVNYYEGNTLIYKNTFTIIKK